jgi:hypothetical protein
MGHVEIDRQTMERYIPIIRSRVTAMAEAIGSVSASDHDAVQVARGHIQDKIDAILSVTLDAMNAERTQAQHAHDSPEEYQRISTACPAASAGVPPAHGRP